MRCVEGPDGPPVWADAVERETSGHGVERVEIRFIGRDLSPGVCDPVSPDAALRMHWRRGHGGGAETGASAAPSVAWARQVHSARALEGLPGCCGEGDALVTSRRELALAVATADCVPVLLASRDAGGGIAAVHAGWRGIAQKVVTRALARITARRSSMVAWIGPAIGPCCYEVGPEVADEVMAACGPVRAEEVVRLGSDPGTAKPRLDLSRAVELQLLAAGVEEIRRLGACTRCHPRELWSYRRDGASAGRNLAYVWVSDLRASTPRGLREKARS